MDMRVQHSNGAYNFHVMHYAKFSMHYTVRNCISHNGHCLSMRLVKQLWFVH